MLSPDESWIVYRIGSGTYEQMGSDFEPYRFEYENLETMSVDGTQGPYRLSQNGGAWRAAWSPNSEQIAYSDYDEKGIHQLFIINRDGSKRSQMTSFTGFQVEIMKILWSPNEDKIAVVVDQDGDYADDNTIILNLDEKTSPKVLENVIAAWWRDNNSLVAWKHIAQEPAHAELITIDTDTRNEFTIRPDACHRINPFGNTSMLGCMTLDYDFFVYDTQSGNAVMYPKFDPNRLYIHYWIAAPDSYPGVNGCGFTP
jgi:Tol biopolymer transport system component